MRYSCCWITEPVILADRMTTSEGRFPTADVLISLKRNVLIKGGADETSNIYLGAYFDTRRCDRNPRTANRECPDSRFTGRGPRSGWQTPSRSGRCRSALGG